MPFHILIREASPDDAAAILTAMRSVMAEPDNHLNSSVEAFSPTETDEREFITRVSANENALMLVAENFVHGEIVGVLTCMGDNRISRRHNTRLGILVTAAWRGRGIGERLMKEAVGWAQRHAHIRRIELDVLVRNTSAITLYQKLGFVVEGTARGAVFKRGMYLDSYYMALQLDGLPLLPSQPLIQGVYPPVTTPNSQTLPTEIDDPTA
jgi:RimJ/RimL family protein N-acetyltransferase